MRPGGTFRARGTEGLDAARVFAPGTRRAAGGWTRLALAARPVRGLWRTSIALRILPSPYPLQHGPFSEGALALSRPTTGLPGLADRPVGRYDTDPISRRERGRRKSLRATTLARDGGSGGNGIGNANWLSRYVRCRRHHLFSCQGAVRRARAMAGGSGSSACMRGPDARDCVTSQHFIRRARSPCICRGQSVAAARGDRAMSHPACVGLRVGTG